MKISIVIPTYNEAGCLARTLAAARDLPGDFEILVVDGGSTDATVRIAAEMGIEVVEAPRGRAAQMNHGAARARGEVLLFVHADTLLPQDAHARIESALRDPQVLGGCFRLSFDRPHPMLRVYAFFTRFPCRLFHYGDQAFFVRADAFRKLDGYRAYPIMEDLDFWLRMVRAGKVAVLGAPVVTSARRYSRHGAVRQQLLNLTLVVLFFLGVSPFTLTRFYRIVR
jgi:rSAM/selenodomain-associated transferase 2